MVASSAYILTFQVLTTLTDLMPVSIATLLAAMAQRSTLWHAKQKNNEARDDRMLSHLRVMGVEPLSTSKSSLARLCCFKTHAAFRVSRSHNFLGFSLLDF